MFSALFWIAAGTLVSEDIACVTAGALIAQGAISPSGGIAACIAGIFAGDLLLFALGRLAGPSLLAWPWTSRYLPPDKVARAAEWLETRGLGFVFLSRFTPGLRLPTYFAAGILKVNLLKFSLVLFGAALLWTPLIVGATASVSPVWIPAILLSSYLLQRLARQLSRYEVRRRWAGAIRRRLQWEFWPTWMAYLPLVPYLLYLAARHRSLLVFMAANPGIATGGLVGESKSEILEQLAHCPDAVPVFTVVPVTLGPDARLEAAKDFLLRQQLTYPVVLKPDVGERGKGVAIIRDEQALRSYLNMAAGPVILQKYVPGHEFGVFYYRIPGQAHGRILSITEKAFPQVTGDGQSTVENLILADDRAVCIAPTYARLCRTPMDYIPAAGERIPLVEIGSHCRGTIFLDARHLNNPALEQRIDEIAHAHSGFYIGRFDVRAESREAFTAGRTIQVMELNGVGGEAAHIYDPAVPIVDKYRSLATQWRLAFEIGSRNRGLLRYPA